MRRYSSSRKKNKESSIEINLTIHVELQKSIGNIFRQSETRDVIYGFNEKSR